MREITISTLIIVFIIVSGIAVQKYLVKSSEDLIKDLKDLKQELIRNKETKNIARIKEKLEEVIKNWEDKEKVWATIIMHEELDNIEVSLLTLKSYAENEEIADALSELEKSIFWIGHITEKEDFKIKNIF